MTTCGMSDMDNYHQVLELNHDASIEEIKNSFRRLALRYHPDRNRDPNSTQKFIKIVEAYEALCHEKVEKLNDFTELLIKPGSVSIETFDKYVFAKITQGNAYFYGILRSSQNSQFFVVFRDGFGNFNRWINGKIYLIERDYLLWIKEFERPINAAISDNGTIALLHTFNKDRLSSSSPKEFIDLGGTLTVMERSGKSLFTYEFGSNIQGCAISQNGNLVSVATLYPDNSIYCFDVERKTLSWRYPIHTTKMPVLGLEFRGNQIEVFSGSNIATMGKKYTLTIDGILLAEYEDKLDALKKIIKLLMFVAGGVVGLLLYLQQQQIISVNIERLEDSSMLVLTSIASSLDKMTQIGDTASLGIPLVGGLSAGLAIGFMKG
jgi:curved DNA-binding protein CbpA/uncharacterized membrane protein (Fun14 family)